MKQPILKWLSCSLILLFALSCRKKQKGALDDFDSGRFDFVCIWNTNGVQDTATGEVSGPYTFSQRYYFMVKQELGTTMKSFGVGGYSGIVNSSFSSQGLWSLSGNIPFPPPGLWIGGIITYEEHDSDHLLVYFDRENEADTTINKISGTFKLIRK
ncbi:hypothetical protein [Fluviicola sp.]|jgi:hypothetical protein|uniref:hypothetical protein n=1 Tax=Fluviicola sp. TaxID=1917219 RepID=UPI002832E9E9|nr:hypothetical protein [Fluviicola sp.]MDR0803231.1 hypothetical protein [Fluviicola sp.]